MQYNSLTPPGTKNRSAHQKRRADSGSRAKSQNFCRNKIQMIIASSTTIMISDSSDMEGIVSAHARAPFRQFNNPGGVAKAQSPLQAARRLRATPFRPTV